MCWLQQSAQLWYYPSFLLIILAAVAAIECFAGFCAWRFLIGLNGAVLGFIGGAIFGAMFGTPMMMLAGALAGAIAGAALFAGIVQVGTFVVASGSTASMTMLLTHLLHMPGRWALPLAAVAGLWGGVAALVCGRPVIIAIAAIAGAQQLHCACSTFLLPGDVIPIPDVMGSRDFVSILGLALAGLVVQLATMRRSGSAAQEEQIIPAANRGSQFHR